MRRILFVILPLCLLLTGCIGKTGQPEQTGTEQLPAGSLLDYDAQNKFRGLAPRIFSFQEAEDFFCGSGFSGKFIYYYDKANKTSGVLCADPSCTHNTVDCGAYADYGSFFCDGEGVCYWIGEDPEAGRDHYLWRGDLAGTSRVKVKRLSFEDIIVKYNPQHYEIHRGRLYILGLKQIVDGVNVQQQVILVSTPLDSSEEFTVLFDETFTSNIHPSVRFVEDDIYLTMQQFSEGGPFDVTILKFDSESGASERVFEESGMSESISPAWVTKEGEIYLPGRNDSCAYVWKLENGERIEVFSWKYMNPACPNIFDGIAVLFYLIDDIRCVDIINLSGETLYSGRLLPESIPGVEGNFNDYSYAIIGGDTEKIILNLQNFTGTGLSDYTILLDLKENLKPTILWSTQQ